MRRRMLSQMQKQQDEMSRSKEVKARLVPAISLTLPQEKYGEEFLRVAITPIRAVDPVTITHVIQNDSAAFQGVAQSSPAGSVPPAQPAPIKRGPGRPRKYPIAGAGSSE